MKSSFGSKKTFTPPEKKQFNQVSLPSDERSRLFSKSVLDHWKRIAYNEARECDTG